MLIRKKKNKEDKLSFPQDSGVVLASVKAELAQISEKDPNFVFYLAFSASWMARKMRRLFKAFWDWLQRNKELYEFTLENSAKKSSKSLIFQSVKKDFSWSLPAQSPAHCFEENLFLCCWNCHAINILFDIHHPQALRIPRIPPDELPLTEFVVFSVSIFKTNCSIFL